MRYKCVGNPTCLKTFEYGHALRAHVAACEVAQKILKAKSEVERLEHEINVEYPGINGLHRNPHFPGSYNLDQTLRFNFKDRFKFGPNPDGQPRRVVKDVENANGHHNSNQVKVALSHVA